MLSYWLRSFWCSFVSEPANSIALAIWTPAGIIVHSGDFKIDDAPVDGAMFDRERFAELGAEGVALLLSDSTNADRPGYTES